QLDAKRFDIPREARVPKSYTSINDRADRMELSHATVGKWHRRFLERRINGPVRRVAARQAAHDRRRPCGGADHNKTLHTKPADGSTHWSVRSIADETGISPTSAHRYFKRFGSQPHRTKSFKLSSDPFFIEKLRDVVGLYRNPPENALVLCVDKKSQCQGLERTQPRAVPSANNDIGMKSCCPSCAISRPTSPTSSTCI